MKKEIKWSIAAVLLLCMGVVVYFLIFEACSGVTYDLFPG